jgi:transcriptional regulator with XRE-family HTH domain
MTTRSREQGVLAKRLWSLRTKARLSRHSLAQESGVSRHQIESLEQGRENNPTLRTLVGLAGALGVTVGELTEGADPDWWAAAPGDKVPRVTN